jgi:riboflavin synthase
VGEPVNIETDLIGKYVEKLLSAPTSDQSEGKSMGLTRETLLKYGFGK